MIDPAGADSVELDIAVTAEDVVFILGKARENALISDGASAAIDSIHILDVALA